MTRKGLPVSLAAARRAGLVDQVIAQLRQQIAQGAWAIGARIPPEPELAATFGVARNTVREAVRALAHAGLLEVRQGDGTYVRATSEVCGAVRRLCGTELREVLQVRRTLEVEAARLAATERTDADLAELTELLARRDEAAAHVEDPRRRDEFAQLDAEFHLAVVRCSHNRLLTELYRGLTEVITASVATAAATSVAGHSGILDAISARDADRAAAEAAGFLTELLASLDSVSDQRGP